MRDWQSRTAPIEAWLEVERAVLPVWAVVLGGLGIALWFWLPGPGAWQGAMLVSLGTAAAGLAVAGGRLGRALMWGGVLVAVGLGGMWLRAVAVDAPRLRSVWTGPIEARVEQVELLGARRLARATIRVASPDLPAGLRARLTMSLDRRPDGFDPGAVIRLKARLAPPPPMALPGAHDFARDFYFDGVGASGRALGAIAVVTPGRAAKLATVRTMIEQRIARNLPADEAGIAVAMAVGDQDLIPVADANAMRRAGLAHLLSVSGLHIAAAVAAAMLLTLRLLALSERLALRYNLVMVAGGAGALTGIGYTVLTGMQVPTIRSCLAALMVLGALALGREALSIRLVAVGAGLILLLRPEVLVGPSFQLSFAAIVAIVTLHALAPVRRFAATREEGPGRRLLRSVAVMLMTGLVVELALMPLALFHFHKAGVYGVGANLIAIPLTTFVIMPAEALALVLDPIGLGAPLWTITGGSIGGLLRLAHWVGAADGAVATAPAMPRLALLLIVGGGGWIALWSQRQRWWGITPVLAGVAIAWATPTPALLITGDGRHLALVGDNGVPLLLRERAGDFTRALLAENSGFDGEPLALDQQQGADCNRIACLATIDRDGRRWRLLATRGSGQIDRTAIGPSCRMVDIVVSDRTMPMDCRPRWLLLDRATLQSTGGVAIALADHPRLSTVAARQGHHPWW